MQGAEGQHVQVVLLEALWWYGYSLVQLKESLEAQVGWCRMGGAVGKMQVGSVCRLRCLCRMATASCS